MRAAAARTFCTAGSSRAISTAMMAITPSSSISVKPLRRLMMFLLMRRLHAWVRANIQLTVRLYTDSAWLVKENSDFFETQSFRPNLRITEQTAMLTIGRTLLISRQGRDHGLPPD